MSEWAPLLDSLHVCLSLLSWRAPVPVDTPTPVLVYNKIKGGSREQQCTVYDHVFEAPNNLEHLSMVSDGTKKMREVGGRQFTPATTLASPTGKRTWAEPPPPPRKPLPIQPPQMGLFVG